MGIEADQESLYERVKEMLANQPKFTYTPQSPNPFYGDWAYNGWQHKSASVNFTFEEPEVKPEKNASGGYTSEEWAEKWIGENQTKCPATGKEPSTPGSKPKRTTKR